MKKIANIDEALAYVRRLGFAPAGTIHHQQICLYALCEALDQAAGRRRLRRSQRPTSSALILE